MRRLDRRLFEMRQFSERNPYVVGAIGIVEIFDAGEVMALTALIGGFAGALSLILPGTTSTITGDFRGLFPGKNQLGEAMAIGVLGGLHGIRAGGGV